MFLQSLLSFSQYYAEDDYYFVNKPTLTDVEKFYFNEYEFNPVDDIQTLVEIETLAKSNENPTVVYGVVKQADNSVKVTIRANDKLFSESYYKNGLLNGTKTIYHGNGLPFHKIDFENGKVNGLYKMYKDKNYELVFETNYKDNLKHGKRTFYSQKRNGGKVEGMYEKGVLVSDLTIFQDYEIHIVPNNLKKGTVKQFRGKQLVSEYEIIGNAYIHGIATVYNLANGKPYSKVPYAYDKKNGLAEFYSEKGELMTKNEYKNDKKVGTHQLYSKDFKLTAVENYDAFGNPNGIWTKYRYDGKTSSIKEYLPNGSINYTTFDTNEVLNSITVYEPNNLRSYITKRYELENISSEEIIKNNKTLNSKTYYRNGSVFSIETSKNGSYERQFFDKEGKLIHVNKISDQGKRIGIHKNAVLKEDEMHLYDEMHYDNEGNKTKWIYKTNIGKIEYNYRNNTQHGKKINYDEAGNSIKEEYYFETNGKSKFVTKEEFETLSKDEKK